LEYEKEAIIIFIDIKKDYDSMRRETIWEGLERIRIPNGMIRIQKIYGYCLSVVQVGNKILEWFKAERGVRQGSILSQALFNVVMDEIVEMVTGQVKDINVMIYADDILIREDSEESLERELSKWQSNLEEKD
jgi:hypothetical protein